jgi:hypothetical protein
MATVVSRLVFVAFMVLAVSVKGGAAEPSRTLTVRFQNGDFVPGNLAEIAGPPAGVSASSDSLGLLKWRSSAFLEPLSVPWELVQTIHAPAIVDPPQVPAAPFGFELVSGETIYGDLKSLSLDEIEIASRVLGPLRVPRGVVRQFFANNNSPSVFAGPQGLRGWYSARPKEPHFGMNPWAQNPDLQIEWVRSPFRLKHWGDSEAPATSVLGAQIRSELNWTFLGRGRPVSPSPSAVESMETATVSPSASKSGTKNLFSFAKTIRRRTFSRC